MSHKPSLPPSKMPHVGTTIFTEMTALAQAHGALNVAQGFPESRLYGLSRGGCLLARRSNALSRRRHFHPGRGGRRRALFCEELFRSHDGDGAGLDTQGTAPWIVGTNRPRLKTDPRTRLTASVDLSVRDLNVLRSHLYFQELLLELSSGCRHCCRSPLSLLKLRLLCRLRSVHTISAGEA